MFAEIVRISREFPSVQWWHICNQVPNNKAKSQTLNPPTEKEYKLNKLKIFPSNPTENSQEQADKVDDTAMVDR